MTEKGAAGDCEVGCDVAGELNSIMNSSQVSSASSADGQSRTSLGIVHNVPGSSCRFPKLEECAHFHYERVQLAPIDVRLVEEKAELLNSGFWFILRVSARQSEPFLIKRSLENLKMLDEMFHQCVYNRQVTGLPCIAEVDVQKGEREIETLVADYFEHFSCIAPDSMTCGPVLTWFQLDNKGRRLPVADTDMRNSINTPAVGAAYGVRKYVSQACDEISIEVGDMISVIDMPSPAESIWWRGKKSHTQKSQYEVGFFPQNCVATIGEKIPRHMPLPAPLVGSLALSPTKPVLRKHGKLIAFFRSFILSRPSRRRLKASGIYKERVFSCDLSEHLLNSGQDIPMVLKCCAEFIEEYGTVDGIYRLSGITSNIQKLRRAFDEERIPDLQQSDIKQDIHAVSSLLKMYFRELPNPLCTYQLYDKFVEAIQSPEEGEDKLNIMRKTVQKLPPPHYRTLKYLATHLHNISKHSERTGMTDRNLAIVWAPNLLRSPTLESGGVAALRGVGVQAVVTEYLITNSEQIFNAEFIPHSVDDSCTLSRSSGDCGSVDHDSLSIERPKSLNVTGGTKLISLEEAQIRQNRIDIMDKTISVNSPHSGCMSYIEVGGGPSSLPDKYHTVLPVPRSWQKRKTHSWKSIFSRTPRQSNGNTSTPTSKDIRVILTPSQDEDDLKPINSPSEPITPLEEKSSLSKVLSAAENCDRKPMTMDICIRSNSVDSLRTTGHSRSVSHDSYFDLLQSPLRGIVNCPSRELSELGLNFDREEPEMRIFSESESLVSSPRVAKDSTIVSSSVRRVLRARPEEFTSTANSVNPSPKKQPRLNCQSPNTWTLADESSCKRYKLEDQLSDIQFIDCGTPEHSTQYTSAQIHNPPDIPESPATAETPTPTTVTTLLDDFLLDSPMILANVNRFSYPQYDKNPTGKYESRFSYPGNGKNVKFTGVVTKEKPEERNEQQQQNGSMEEKKNEEQNVKNLQVATPPSSHHSPRYSLLVGETSSDNSSSVTTTPMFDVDISGSTTKDSSGQNEKNFPKEMKPSVDIVALKRKFSLELEAPSSVQQMEVDGTKLQLPSTPNTPNFTQTSGNTSQSMTPSEFDYQQLNRGGVVEVTPPDVSPRVSKSPESGKKPSTPIKSTISITYNLKSPTKTTTLEKSEQSDEAEGDDPYEKIEFEETKKAAGLLETNLDDGMVYEKVKFFKNVVSEVNQMFSEEEVPQSEEKEAEVKEENQQQIVPDIDMISPNDDKTEEEDADPPPGEATTPPANDIPMPLPEEQDFDIKDSLEFDANLSLYENVEMKKPQMVYENVKVDSGSVLMEFHPKKEEKKPNNYLVKQLATRFETSPVENQPPFDFSKSPSKKNLINKPLSESMKVTRSLDESAFIWEFGPPAKLTEKFRNRSSQQIPEIIPEYQRRKSLEFTRPKSLNPPKKLPVDLTSANDEICKSKIKMDLNKLSEESAEDVPPAPTGSEETDEEPLKITPTTENRISLIQNNFTMPCTEDRLNVSMRVLGNYKLDRERIEKIKEERRLQLSEKFRSESFKSLERDPHPKSKSKSELRETKENDDSFRVRSKSRGEGGQMKDEKNRSEEFIYSSSLTRRIRRGNDGASSLDCGLNQRLSGKEPGLRLVKVEDYREREAEKAAATNYSQREKCSPQFSIKDVTAMFESRSQNHQ